MSETTTEAATESITAHTLSDDRIRELRTEVMREWGDRGKKEPWPEGREILGLTLDALLDGPEMLARQRLAEIINARRARKG
jgi:hypothetical protein